MSNKTSHLPTSDWVENTLGEVVKFNYGKGLIASKRLNGNIPVYGSSGITGYHNKALINKKGLIIGRKGTVGSLYKSLTPFYPIDTVFYLTENDTKLDFDFLYYFIKTLRLDKKNGDSAVPGLNRNEVYSIPIKFPVDRNEQKAIASVLSAFDDKIELLREENKTLEEIGQTIFKEWFGKYWIYDELPKGWRVGKIGEVVNLLNGFAYKSSDFIENGKYRLVTIANVQDGSFVENTKDGLDEIPQKMPKYCNLKTGDILLSLTGNVGRVCYVIGENYLLNQRVAKLQAKDKKDYGFIYTMFRQNSMIGLLQSISTWTAQQNLSPIKTTKLEIIIPSRKILNEFANIINPMIDKILDNKLQIQTLTKLRDTLLPKLMSGKIRVKF